MIAPNGKQSNLTDIQYKLVRTPAFKEWFGDWEFNPSEASKVVDENGEPLVVYHGTNAEFFIFGEGKNKNILDEYQENYAFQKKVNYFHKSKEYSETFGSKYGGYEKSFFLDIKKIALVDEDTIEDIGYWKNIYEYNVIIKQLDGIYSKSGQYATLLNPHQIKLADGSNTTFDSNNPDIRFKQGGMTNKGYVSYKDKYNTKYGYSKGESHDLKEISKDTGVSIKGLQQIYNKGIGAYKTNPSSVRPNVKSKEQWAMARVYSSVMGGKASKIDSNELKMEKGGNIKNITEVVYKDDGNTLIYGTKNNKTTISLNKLSQEDIKMELDFEKEMLNRQKYDLPNKIDNNNKVQNSFTSSLKEKDDSRKLLNSSIKNIEILEKIVIPFYESKLVKYEQGGNINIKNNNMSKHKDGLFVGKSHKEGGIPLVVKSTGQNIEVEGGEIMTNKTSVADTKIRTLTGTNCEIISQINSQNGNGVTIDCDSVVGKKYEYKTGGMIFEPKFMHPTNSKMKSALKNDFNINFKQPNIYYPKQSLGLKRNQMPQIRKQFLPILFETLSRDGIKYEDSMVSANSLKPSQNEINIDVTKTFNEQELYEKNVIVSSDNYVIDGHHRWYYCLENNIPVKITKIDLPIEEALNYIRQLDFIEQDEIAKRGMLINSQKSLFDGGGNVDIKGKIQGKVIHKEYGIEYYDNGSLIQPTKETKLQWEMFGFPNNIEKKEQSFETIIDEIYGNSQKEISNKFDNNLTNDKYSYLGFNPNLSLIYDKSKFESGGNIEVDKYSEEIPMSIYKGVIGDFDNDNISNADDLQPNVPSKVKLEEISFKDELTDIIKYRNLFVDVQKKVLSKIKKINTCGKIQCEIKTRIKTPYSIINKLRRRSLTDVKTLDKLDKKAKEFLKNKDLKGIDLYKGLTDILGFMVIVEDFNFLSKLKSEVEAGNLGEVLEFEDFYKNDLNGYRAYHFLLSTEINGTFIPYELQLRTMRVNELAKLTHTIYKQGKLNGTLNNKIAKEIELADKGNNVIAKIIDKKLEDKNLVTQLTTKKLAFGDIIASGFLSSFKYKVRNDVNKLITSVTEYGDSEAEARKDLYRKYKNFTLLGISVNDGDYVPINEYVENKKDRSQIDLFDTESRFEYAREMKKGGVIYRDLSTIKPQLVMESENSNSIEVDEVSIVKTGEKFAFNKRKISSSQDSYDLLKDFWNKNNINVVEELNVILLDKQNKPISIYRHSKGGIDATIGDIEVISAVAVKTLAKGVIMSHNHPSGNLTPSPADLEISKQLKNALKLFNIVLLDSLIVTETDYYSMADNGVFKLGGHIDSYCDCSKCRAYDSTIIIDEADTTKGKMLLIKLRDIYYIIYDDEIVLESSELKYAKREFESNLYYDKLKSKNTFAKGGIITDAEYKSLEKIVPKNMLLSIKETKESWERGDSDDVFEHYENLIEGYREIPNLYFQDEKGKNAVVYLHYFYGGSDWYITELDKETNEAYGYAILNGDTQNSAFGYMSLSEFTDSIVDLDLYWSFQTLNEIFEKKYPELVDGEIEYYNKDATLTRLTNFEVLIEKNDFKNQYEVNQFIELMIDEKLFESNNYTTIEKSFLQRYSGMGGLQKYGATGKGILWEYYTPKKVADIMWALAYKHKSVSKFDRVLENSVGVGTFVNTCPLQVGSMDCYDISKYAIAICLILYGKDERFQFFHKSFETLFFIGNSSVKGNVEPIYDLVIGNPPYSKYSGKYAGLGEKKYTKAKNWIDYFIFRSLDLLKSGGLLVFILGSVKGVGQDNWLESEDNYTKEKIKEKAELVDALRLGSGVFEFTDVDSDIIVLRKK